MKKLLIFPLFALLLTGCTEYDAPQSYNAPIQQSAVAEQAQVKKNEPEVIKAVQTKNKTESEAKVIIPVKTVEAVKTAQKVERSNTVSDVPLSNDNYYVNSQGNTVHSPALAPSIPVGASAQCRDGTYSFSQSRRGTCSNHGGVVEWY